MKTQLLALESHDDIISVKDRMSWAKTPRILLIWPKGERIALRPLDLKMLQRHARSLGASLGLVARDPRVQREAAALGLPVFASPRAAHANDWPPACSPKFSGYRKPVSALRAMRDTARPTPGRWRGNPIVRVFFFSLGVLAVLVLVALFLPHAEVTLRPETQSRTLTIPVVADPALDSVFITGSLPARTVTREIVGSQKIPSTGEVAIPEIEAKGVARFSNLTTSKINLPPGTVVQTLGASSIRFVTTQVAQVPAGVGKTVDVPIQAVDAGSNGNLETNLIQAVEGPLGLSLSVTNPAPTSGGMDRMVFAPSRADRERLRNILLANLRTQVQEKMLDSLPEGSVIFPGTVAAVAVPEEVYDPPVGGMGEALTLTLRVKFSAQYVSGDDLSTLAALARTASLEEGFSAPALPELEVIGDPFTDETGRTNFQLRVEYGVRRALDPRRIIYLVRGRNVELALGRLEEAFVFSDPPNIKIVPAWWPNLPLVPFRIEVVVE